MNNENTKRLLEAFPLLFQRGIVPQCGDGWYQLIHVLSADIYKEAMRIGRDPAIPVSWPAVVQIKEKFGTLRYYMRNSTGEIQALINAAEQKSRTICEDCGKPGELRSPEIHCVKCHACLLKAKLRRSDPRAMIVFLDFDGVLHPDEVYFIKGKGVKLIAEGHKLFEHADLLAAELDNFPDVRIVLSTSWVSVLDFKRAKSYLPERMQERVMGSTWHSKFDRYEWQNLTRFQQIYQYVNRHNITNWIAIDNDDEDWPDFKRQHLVHTDDWKGLGCEDAQDDLTCKLKMREVDDE